MPAIVRRTALATVAVLVVSVAGVGLFATGVAVGAGSAPTGSAATAATAEADSTAGNGSSLATDIDALLAADQTAAPAPAASSDPTPGRARIHAAIGGLRRLAAARKLVHATVVADLPKLGGLTTIQLDHGTISAVSATSLSISETGGTTASVTLGDETRVRRNAAPATVGDLKTGDEVFVMSRVESGGTVAYLVVVPAV